MFEYVVQHKRSLLAQKQKCGVGRRRRKWITSCWMLWGRGCSSHIHPDSRMTKLYPNPAWLHNCLRPLIELYFNTNVNALPSTCDNKLDTIKPVNIAPAIAIHHPTADPIFISLSCRRSSSRCNLGPEILVKAQAPHSSLHTHLLPHVLSSSLLPTSTPQVKRVSFSSCRSRCIGGKNPLQIQERCS